MTARGHALIWCCWRSFSARVQTIIALRGRFMLVAPMPLLLTAGVLCSRTSFGSRLLAALLLVRPRSFRGMGNWRVVVADGSCSVGGFGKTWAGGIAGGMRMLRAWVRVMGTISPVDGSLLIGVNPECGLDILSSLVVADV